MRRVFRRLFVSIGRFCDGVERGFDAAARHTHLR